MGLIGLGGGIALAAGAALAVQHKMGAKTTAKTTTAQSE